MVKLKYRMTLLLDSYLFKNYSLRVGYVNKIDLLVLYTYISRRNSGIELTGVALSGNKQTDTTAIH
jgi:hypothetical protein